MITAVAAVTDEVVDAVRRLLPQLSPNATLPSRADLERVVASPATTLLVARDGADGAIVGMLTLAVFRVPTAVRAWIEDVVVDARVRGRGIGEALVRDALGRATAAGARSVELTSRPGREAANRLYVRLGFTRRETNVYRYEIPSRPA
jgi:ribosomal protein S18 acetylase RimI-like enzyme